MFYGKLDKAISNELQSNPRDISEVLFRKIPQSQYSLPHGQCKSVGVAGFLLGGGVNWLGTFNK